MYASTLLIAAAATSAMAAKFGNPSFSEVTAGSPFEITWLDASGPVTITLKSGSATALNDVSTIASGLSGTSFTWTPSASLTDGPYALEIEDSTGPNYSVQFPINGASAASGTSAIASASASATRLSSGLASSALSSAIPSTTLVSSAVASATSATSVATSAALSASTSAATSPVTSGASSRVSASSATRASSQTTRSGTATSTGVSVSASANAAVQRDSNAAIITLLAVAVLGAAGNL